LGSLTPRSAKPTHGAKLCRPVGAFKRRLLGRNAVQRRAEATAERAIAVNAQNADAHYILGKLDLLDEKYDLAYKEADTIVAVKPEYASAYRLKGEALLGSFAAQSGSVDNRRADGRALLSEAKNSFEKYLSFIADEGRRKELAVEVETLKAFAEYIAKNKGSLDITAPDPGRTPVEIVEKPRPIYTDDARMNNIQGTILLLVAFQSDGKIGR
jgi:tetratricopeptide (TPR) repeat protein